MNTTAIFSFEKFSKLETKYINLFNADLLDKCQITLIVANNIINHIEVQELIFKNELQHKIISSQYEQLDKIYDEISLLSHNNHKYITQKDKKFIDDIDASDYNTIKQFSDLDLLSNLKIYRNSNPSTTHNDIITESMYIKNLLFITGIQRNILNKQEDQLVYIAKTFINSELAKKNSTSIQIGDSKLNIKHVIDKCLIDTILQINKTESDIDSSQRKRSLASEMRILTGEQFLEIISDNKSKPKPKTKKKKSKPKKKCSKCQKIS